jgi:hypothetical protein
MNNPKFAIGDKVAVCSFDLKVVFPVAEIVARHFCPEGYSIDYSTKQTLIFNAAWYYQVDQGPIGIDGTLAGIDEAFLRPINPDTEYLTLNAQSPVEVEA